MPAILLVLLAACARVDAPDAKDARVVRVVATDFAYDVEVIEAEPGEALRVVLRNDGTHPHNIEFELPDGEVEVEGGVAPGDMGEVLLWAPLEDGAYVYYCPVGDHRGRGMEGSLVVGEGDGTTPF